MFMSRVPREGVLSDSRARMPTEADIKMGTLAAANAMLEAGAALGTYGLTNPNNTYENQTVKHSYHLGVFHEGQESELEQYCPVFIHRPTTLTLPNGTICALTVPQINYYLELSVRDRSVNVRRPVDVLRKSHAVSNQFYTYSMEEFQDSWNFLGSLDVRPKLAKMNTEGGTITPSLNPAVAVNTAGVVRMKQMFAETLQPNDHVYWLVKHVESPYKAFYGLKGETIAPKTPHGTSFLQIIPFSDKDTVIPYPSTANSADQDPLFYDRCSMVRNQKLESLWNIVEHDELNGYNIRPGEKDDIPPIVVDAYEEGLVIPVGIVQRADPRPVSHHQRLLAYRDIGAMKDLPNVTVIRSASSPY